MRVLAVALGLTAALVSVPAAADDDSPGPRGEDLRITVLTIGPGEHPFYKFGHDAIWVHDDKTGDDAIYNYGMFSFGDPAILLKFFLGRFDYWVAREEMDSLGEYREDQRVILAQELELTPAERVAIERKLAVNVLPENRAYKYDYYRDNCATRVRDIIDQATHGRLRAASEGPGTLTYREHTLRLTSDAVAENLLLDLAMGPLVDRPISRWDEMFLPEKIAETLRLAHASGEGGARPLVRSELVLFQPEHVEPHPDAPRWGPAMGAAGVGLGAIFAGLGWAASRWRAARVAFGVALAIFGSCVGFFGNFFLAAWAFTDHAVGYRNENAFQMAPWSLAVGVAGVALAAGARWAPRFARRLVEASLAASVVGLLVKVLPWFPQHNGRVIAFMLPAWIGLMVAMAGLSPRRAPASSARSEAPAESADAAPHSA